MPIADSYRHSNGTSKQDVARRARVARTQVMRELLGRIADAVQAASASGRGLGRAMVAGGAATCVGACVPTPPGASAGVPSHQLGSLSDLALKDMGISAARSNQVLYGLHREEWIERGRLASPATGKPQGEPLSRTSRADGSRRTPPNSCIGQAASTERWTRRGRRDVKPSADREHGPWCPQRDGAENADASVDLPGRHGPSDSRPARRLPGNAEGLRSDRGTGRPCSRASNGTWERPRLAAALLTPTVNAC